MAMTPIATPEETDIDWAEMRRVLCRESLIGYIEAVAPWFKIEEIHCVIAEHLEAVARGEIDRLMISMPPRTGKSRMASIFFPSWYTGKFPTEKILQVGHSTPLSRDFSLDVRELMRLPNYRWIFPGVHMAKGAGAAGKWRIEEISDLNAPVYLQRAMQGEYRAAGVTSGIAGTGFNLGILDDPMALHVDTPVPTTKGFVRIADLCVGDEVYGPDGLPTRVMAKSDVRSNRPLYRVTTSDGQTILCDGGHLWPYMSDTAVRKAKVKTAKAREMAAWRNASRPCLPRHQAVQYPERTLPIAPWVLGAWLGDGTASAGKITAHPNDAPYMRDQFHAAGYQTTDQADPYNFGVLGLWRELRVAGLLGNKHVPEQYLIGSIAQRMALLQGLMDTDGGIAADGQCTFSNTNRQLADAVVSLLHSLGVKAQVISSIDTRHRWGSAKRLYSVNFRLKDAARMPRKAARSRTPTDKRARSYAVEPAGVVGDVQCISVAREDGLFLCGYGYVVTHNSEQDKDSKIVKDRLWNWYGPGFYTRRQPEKNAILLSMTRWGTDDLPGRLIEQGERVKGADMWTILNVPAILDKEHARKIYTIAKDYGAIDAPIELREGDSFSPRRWPLKELMRSKAQNTDRDWRALYMGQPTDLEGHVLKKRHWRLWPKKDPPQCVFVFQMYDTAFDEKTAADMSARTTWGIFEHREREGERPSMHMILLEAWEDHVEAPDLKKHVLVGAWGGKEAKKALLEMNPHDAQLAEDIDVTDIGMLPDKILIENKASGIWLIKELRRIRKPRPLPIQPWNAPRGGRGKEMGKYARAIMASLVLEQGAVWYMDRKWAAKVIDKVAELKFDGTDKSDDMGDTITASMVYVRQTYRVELGSDVDEDAEARAKIRKPTRQFYGARRS